MVATLASAALIAAASLIIGQALLALAGRGTWTLLSAPVGLALLMAAAAIPAGLGARGLGIAITLTALILLSLATLAATSFRPSGPGLRGERAGAGRRGLRSMDVRMLRGREAEPPPEAGPRPIAATGSAWAPPLAAALIAAAFTALPFIVAGRVGILGVGLVNDDMAYHLLMADWIAERFSPEPELIGDGYPLGPHSLVAGLGTLIGARSIDAFAGLVLAIPALTALVAYAALGGLHPAVRALAAALVAVPYLAAAYLAQSAFKEPIMALFLIGFVLLGAGRAAAAVPRYAWGRGLALGAIAAGVIYVYSFPGLAWIAAAAGIWALAELWRRRARGALEGARSLVIAAAPATLAGAAALVLLSAPDLGRVLDFADFRALDPDQAHEGGLGNLPGHLSPLAALGIWPTSEFRLPAGAGALPALAFHAGALFAGAALVTGLVRWLRAFGPAIPAALAGAAVVYAGARGFGTVYTSAKALSIIAPLVALVALGGLLRPAGPMRAGRYLLAAGLAVGMVASSFLVLRQAPVGPEEHLDQLAEIRPLVEGEDLLFLGRDNFVLYGLRGSRPFVHVRHFYNPFQVAPNEELERARAKFDFDSVDATTLARFDWVLTTRGAYASGPPPGYEPAFETEGYVLWRRDGDPSGREPVEGDLHPGAELECIPGAPPAGARAASLPRRPVLAGDGDWAPSPELEDGAPASAELDLPPGDWELSLQYHSTAPLSLVGRGLDVELAANLDYRGAVPFWPGGRIEGHPGGRLRVEVSVAAPPLAGRILGASTLAHLGTLAATPLGEGYGAARGFTEPPFPGSSAELGPAREACGAYADWVEPGDGEAR